MPLSELIYNCGKPKSFLEKTKTNQLFSKKKKKSVMCHVLRVRFIDLLFSSGPLCFGHGHCVHTVCWGIGLSKCKHSPGSVPNKNKISNGRHNIATLLVRPVLDRGEQWSHPTPWEPPEIGDPKQ